MDQKRVTRSHSEKKRKIEALKDLKTEHFGVDVSSSVKKARLEGGKLDEEERRATTGRIARGKTIGPSLSDLIPKSLAKHILEHRESGDVFSQKDNRIDPRRGGAYKGFLVSSTRVSGDSFDSGLKEIGEPLAPIPTAVRANSTARTPRPTTWPAWVPTRAARSTPSAGPTSPSTVSSRGKPRTPQRNTAKAMSSISGSTPTTARAWGMSSNGRTSKMMIAAGKS